MLRVTIWNEFLHERTEESIRAVYPEGIHNCIKEFLQTDEIEVRTATLDMPECGLPDEVLESTDVMIWWSHAKQDDLPDEIAKKVADRVLKGMGLIVLHSAHKSKPFMRLMGTTCDLAWRDGDRERIWCCNPSHPIAQGIPEHFELPEEEMYGEFFDIPQPDDLIFLGWFRGGEVFRSGCTFRRGHGKVFYFQPGHEAHPIYKNEIIQQIIKNAVQWAKPSSSVETLACRHPEALEK